MNIFTVIIPCYGLNKDFKNNCQKYVQLLNRINSPYIDDWEIVIVFDGQEEKSKNFKKIFQRNKKVKIFEYSKNKGKGYALLYGFKQSRGNYVTFIDADEDIPFQQVINFFPYLATADVVIGSKRHPFSKINYPWKRKILSRGFQLFSKIILNTSLRDTQSGLKIIRREVLNVVSESAKINGFAFDLELCFLAKQLGFKIVEAPIHIDFKGESKIRLKDILSMARDTFKIRFFFSYKKKYQKNFHKKNF